MENTKIKKSHILIVDDNPKNLQVLGNILQEINCEIEFAISGNAALDWIKEKGFDLVLLDINMPKMNGFEVCIKIRENFSSEKLPIIFLTADTDRESILKGFEIGAQDYITKPFDKRELLARVKTQLEIKKSRDHLQNYLRIVEEKNNQITESIEYAKSIQNAIQKASQRCSSCFKESFVLSIPKDIVSGDFYYFQKVTDGLLAGVFDGTGHGIPGAFMSLLGITFLNDIILRNNCYEPGIILSKLREKIIDSMNQKGSLLEVSNGMDGAIINYKQNNSTLTFAGAFNLVIIVRNDELIELKGDRMPLAYSHHMIDFTEKSITVKENDLIYIFSDGFEDQFGGDNNKKLGLKKLKEILMQCSKLPMHDQNQLLSEIFVNYKGKNDQTDDILIVGIKI